MNKIKAKKEMRKGEKRRWNGKLRKQTFETRFEKKLSLFFSLDIVSAFFPTPK